MTGILRYTNAIELIISMTKLSNLFGSWPALFFQEIVGARGAKLSRQS